MHIDFFIPEWLLGVIGTVAAGYILLVIWVGRQF